MTEEPPPALPDSSPGNGRMSRMAVTVMGAGVLSLLAAVTLFVLTLTGIIGGGGYDGPSPAKTFGPSIDSFLTPRPTSTAALPTPDGAPIAVLAIPKYDVSAPVVTRSVDSAGVMQTPDGPTDVAWYDFSAKPGFGSNAVFSGHVDYINYGPAVFWHLKDLAFGDVIEVRLDDSTVYQYKVVSVQQLPVEQANVGEIVGPTPRDIITLITCGGNWTGHEYDSRVVVRAERSYEAAPAGRHRCLAPLRATHDRGAAEASLPGQLAAQGRPRPRASSHI
jgi:LPXTG-site transpeptidase (sortase) family protein